MKRFSFGLQKFLDLYEFAEKQAQEELAKVMNIANAINFELKDIANERVQVQKKYGNVFDINFFRSIELYVNRLDLRKEELLGELAANELLIEQKRALFIEAMQKRKVTSNLKEKHQKAWHDEMLKDEESTIDDITNAKAAMINFED